MKLIKKFSLSLRVRFRDIFELKFSTSLFGCVLSDIVSYLSYVKFSGGGDGGPERSGALEHSLKHDRV